MQASITTEVQLGLCHVPDLRLELVEGLRRNLPLAPIIRDAETQERPLLRRPRQDRRAANVNEVSDPDSYF